MEGSLVSNAAKHISELEGYTVYTHPEYEFFYVVTPNDNVLCICNDDFYGLNMTLEYYPSRENGRGCRCNVNAFTYVTKERMKTLEQHGLAFAHELGAKLFNNSKTFFESYCYFAKDLVAA